MRKKYFVSLDLGTSFIKAGVYDENGVNHGTSHAPVKSQIEGPGTYIQKADDLFSSVIECLRTVIQALGQEKREIYAIAFTGQMAGFMGVDKKWQDITTWSCSLDTRYVPYANRQMEMMEEKFRRIAGTNAPLMAPKCEWFQKEFPEKAKHIAKYMMISGYVIGRLGNMDIEEATIDCSYITWTGLADVKRQVWSEELCKAAGVRMDQLPRIVKSYEICGYLSKEMASVTGLLAGIPLVSGAGDKIAGCIGAGVLNKGDTIFEASSYGAVSKVVDSFTAEYSNKSYDVIPAALSKGYYAHKYIPGSGITLKWFKDLFLKNETGNSLSFAEVDRRVQKVEPGCDGLMAIGLLGGSAMPFDGELRGSFIGHTWNHGPEHFYRALLESYGYETALTLDEIDLMYSMDKKQAVKMIGGGAGSAVWPQIMADICQRDFLCLDQEDTAMWGTAVIAGYGVGIFKNIEETVKENVSVKYTYRPDLENTHIYEQYKKIYEEMRKDFHIYCKTLQGVNSCEDEKVN